MAYVLPQDSGINFTDGIDNIFVYVASQVPLFTPILLFSFFLLVSVGGYFAQLASTNRGDFALWFALAGWATFGFSILMTLADGLINVQTIIITLAVAVAGMLFFVLTDRPN